MRNVLVQVIKASCVFDGKASFSWHGELGEGRGGSWLGGQGCDSGVTSGAAGESGRIWESEASMAASAMRSIVALVASGDSET